MEEVARDRNPGQGCGNEPITQMPRENASIQDDQANLFTRPCPLFASNMPCDEMAFSWAEQVKPSGRARIEYDMAPIDHIEQKQSFKIARHPYLIKQE
jgi:hypothetical protein